MNAYNDVPNIHPEVKAAYCALRGEHYWDAEHCEKSFVSRFDYYEDLKEYVLDSWYEVNEVPDRLAGYIDEDAVLRDLFIETYDYVELPGAYWLFFRC